MTVFVDDMHLHPMGQFGRMKMSHMIADSDEELHAMAVEAGAREITLRQCGCMCAIRRRTGKLGDPDTAVAVCQTHAAERQAAREAAQ